MKGGKYIRALIFAAALFLLGIIFMYGRNYLLNRYSVPPKQDRLSNLKAE